ncbi:thioesterase family protein [Lactococcus fujiensis]|nr:thioesterase family protein [Lactococcus fujiensis]
MSEISIGASASVEITVRQSQTALFLGSGELEVYATPALVALMEEAACNAVKPFLDSNQTTVGTQINISHDQASPVGATITAHATVVALDRRRIDFDVVAKQGEVIISKGIHSRFIVDRQKFMDKLK